MGMSGETQELVRLYEKLPEAERAEVADFARFLLARRAVVPQAQVPGAQAPRAQAPGADASGGAIIRHTEGVVGGDACVRNTRVPVWTLVQLKKLGRTEDELLGDFPGLGAADLDAVWEYYRDHTDEIERAIQAEAGED